MKGTVEGLFAWSTGKGYGMPECCFVSACSSFFSLHSLLCISPFSLPFLFLTLESYSLVPFLHACFVLSRCATRGKITATKAPYTAHVLWARGDQPDDIKERGEHPGRDGYIGDDRVQRMTQPRSVEQAPEASWRLSLRTDHHLDQMLQAIAQPLQERLRRGRRLGTWCLLL